MMRPISTQQYDKYLEDKGFQVDSYEDPHLALKNFKPHYYDLVIIDIKMPQMNGFTFHKESSGTTTGQGSQNMLSHSWRVAV